MSSPRMMTILLFTNLVLLAGILISEKGLSELEAFTAGGNERVLFSQDLTAKNEFYLIDTDQQIILSYRKDDNSGILLQFSRKYDFDKGIPGSVNFKKAGKKKNPQGASYEEVKKMLAPK